jgi:hypothetical protein
MTETLVGYPDEPSRRAQLMAAGILVVAGVAVTRKLREPIRGAVRLASPLLLKPLAIALTRMGL